MKFFILTIIFCIALSCTNGKETADPGSAEIIVQTTSNFNLKSTQHSLAKYRLELKRILNADSTLVIFAYEPKRISYERLENKLMRKEGVMSVQKNRKTTKR